MYDSLHSRIRDIWPWVPSIAGIADYFQVHAAMSMIPSVTRRWSEKYPNIFQKLP